MSKLQHLLVDMDFRDITGTHEVKGKFLKTKTLISIIKDPKNLGVTNRIHGVTVVIDNNGHTWIRGTSWTDETARKMGEVFEITTKSSKCYVPHSNDGGKVVSKMWPNGYR